MFVIALRNAVNLTRHPRQGFVNCRMTHVLLLVLFATSTASAPSRPQEKGCAWEKFSNASVGLEAWVQRCDYGFRKIDFVAQGHSLAIRYSDGGAPENVIDVIDRLPGESGEAAVRRIFAAHSDQALVAKCVARRSRE